MPMIWHALDQWVWRIIILITCARCALRRVASEAGGVIIRMIMITRIRIKIIIKIFIKIKTIIILVKIIILIMIIPTIIIMMRLILAIGGPPRPRGEPAQRGDAGPEVSLRLERRAGRLPQIL